jgi:ADP-heptose:LPS heptosyltransferase
MGGVRGRPALLALRALGLGDLLTAVPALRGLSAAFPDHELVLAAPASLGPLAALAGAADAILPAERLEAVTNLPACAIATNLHGRGPQSHRALLTARPSRLIAFRHPEVAESAQGPEWRAEEHEVHRWCRMVEAFGVSTDPSFLDLPAPDRPIAERASGAVLLHPGAKEPARRWPAARWGELAARLRAGGRRVVVTGGPTEEGLARAVAELGGLDGRAVLTDMDVLDLVAVVAAARLVVAGDTGVSHVATATRTPSIVLFGPTAPDRWGPPSDRVEHRVLWAGRGGDPHAAETFVGLLEIGVDAVHSAADEALARPSGARRAAAEEALRLRPPREPGDPPSTAGSGLARSPGGTSAAIGRAPRSQSE